MKQVFAILSVLLLIIGCDSDAGTGGDGNSNGPDAQVSADSYNHGVDNYNPPEDGNEPYEDGADPPDDTTPDVMDNFMFLQRQWEFTEGGTYTGDYIRSVTIEPASDEYDDWGFEDYDAVAIGFFPEGMPFPLKYKNGMIKIHYCGFAQDCWDAEFKEGDAEIEFFYTSTSTEIVDRYRSL